MIQIICPHAASNDNWLLYEVGSQLSTVVEELQGEVSGLLTAEVVKC